jgi:membrane fusion protein (multidrug efflux system)
MKSRHLLFIAFIAAITGGTYYSILTAAKVWAEAKAEKAPAMEVVVETVIPQMVRITQDYPGRTSSYRIAEIRPQVSGIILKRLFEEGSDVSEGAQLYQIDPSSYKAALQRAEADYNKALAQVKSVKAKAARYEDLVKIGGISKQEYDDIVASLAQSNADVEIGRAAVSTAKINYDYTKVLAPISGRIGVSTVTEGALVTANQPSALSVINQFDKIYVDVTQAASDIVEYRKIRATRREADHDDALLIVDGEIYAKEGRIQFSDIYVDPSTGTVQMRIIFPNDDLIILPGMFVHARLVKKQIPDGITIPQKSVMRSADGSVTIYTVNDENVVQPKIIKVADTIDGRYLVTDGLQGGERIIVDGIMKVKPEMHVSVKEMEVKPLDSSYSDNANQDTNDNQAYPTVPIDKNDSSVILEIQNNNSSEKSLNNK